MPVSASRLSFLLQIAFLSLALLLISPALAQHAEPAASASGPAAPHSPAASAYGRIPLGFEVNRGQADPSVQFLSHGEGYTLFLRPGEALLALRAPAPNSSSQSIAAGPRPAPASAANINSSVVAMRLSGANAHAAANAEDRQITRTSYLIGNDPSKWQTGVANFGRVRYSGIYPGIDLAYYGNQRSLEHDFVVAPGADPGLIRFELTGARRPRIEPATGDLVFSLSDSVKSELRLLRPVTYQKSNGRRTPVPSSYRLLAGHRIGFSVGAYDRSRPLVIDPVLTYSTFVGGTNQNCNCDGANGIAVDSDGNAYIVGTAYSDNYPVTAGSFQQQNNSQPTLQSNVTVSKLNAAGTGLIYSTYIGGSGASGAGPADFGYAIAIDSSGNAYIAGATASPDFPVTCGSYQTVNPSMTQNATVAFVAKLNPAGSALVYSTFLGGEGNRDSGQPRGDAAQAIAVRAGGNAYVTGYTSSPNFPVTDGAYLTTSGTAFVTELNAAGASLVYSTFLDGIGNAIALDPSGDAFVAGGNGGSAFVAELNPDGSDTVYSTSLGTNGSSTGMAIALDSSGDAYVAGTTISTSFPVTAGVVEGSNIGLGQYFNLNEGTGAFLTKLDAEGSIDYSTDLEGLSTAPRAIAVDAAGNAYVAGSASGLNYASFGGFQPTPDALPSSGAGGGAFLVKVNPTASAFSYATILGGGEANGVAVDSSGNAYVAGVTSEGNFPVTSGAYQTTNHGSNAFVSKFALTSEQNQTAYPPLPPPPYPITVISFNVLLDCDNNGYAYDAAVDYSWELDPQGYPTPTGAVSVNWTDQTMASLYNFSFDVSDTQDTASIWQGGVEFLLDSSSQSYTVSYPGDSNYEAFSFTGSMGTPVCQPPGPGSRPAFRVPLKPRHPGTVQFLGAPGRAPEQRFAAAPGPKFPYPVISMPRPGAKAGRSQSSAQQETPACLSGDGPLLTVKVNSLTRAYGSGNPKLTYTVQGLRAGDQISVSVSTAATTASSAGSYPITASVGGASLSKYSVRALPGSLTVTPAPLYVTPRDAYTLAGQKLPTLTYLITGFVNGDGPQVVHGAPVVLSPADSSSPHGAYPLTVAPGTLTVSQNYQFVYQQGELNIFQPIDFSTVFIGKHANAYFAVARGPASTVGEVVPVVRGAVKPEISLSKSILTFAPHAPGLWTGAIRILDNSTPAKTLITVPVYGQGLGPQLVFDPGIEKTAKLVGVGPLVSPQSVAVNDEGTLYILDSAPARIVSTDGNSSSVVPLGSLALKSPSSIVIDGNGDLDVSDTGNNRIVQIAAAGTASVLETPGINLAGPRGLAVTGSGDLLIADAGHNRVVRLSAAGIASVVSTGPLKLNAPSGVAADYNGDIYVADTGNNRIVEVPGSGAPAVIPTGSALKNPTGIAINPAGGLYISEPGSGEFVEVAIAGKVSPVSISGLKSPHGIAIDHSGYLYIADSGSREVHELLGYTTPATQFGSTRIGTRSASSPQTIVVHNIGTQGAAISGVAFPADFPQDPSARDKDCKVGESLARDATCTLTIDFDPATPVKTRSSILRNEAVKVTSNSVNKPGAVMSAPVEGTEEK